MLGLTFINSMIAENPIFNFDISDRSIINTMFNYQLGALIISSICLLMTFLFANKLRLRYMSFNRKGKMQKSKLLLLKEDGYWEEDGWGYGLIVVFIIFIYSLSAFFSTNLKADFSLFNSIIVIPIAAANAFNEEVMYRVSYVTMGSNETKSNFYGLFMGTFVFGLAHYSGFIPNGLIGALMSAYMGFFFSKSIQETKGIYWAFFIHFILDLVILIIFFNGI